MVCIVFYDLENSNARTKVAKQLIQYGLVRIQLSILAGPYDKDTFDKLWQKLVVLIEHNQTEQDKLYYLIISENQFKNMKMFGEIMDLDYICGTKHTIIF